MKIFEVTLKRVYQVTENDVIERLYETKEEHTEKNMILAAEELVQEEFADYIYTVTDIDNFISTSIKTI